MLVILSYKAYRTRCSKPAKAGHYSRVLSLAPSVPRSHPMTEQSQRYGATAGTYQVMARGALKDPDMNRTEARYAALLELRKHAGEILWWKFEGITLKLADDTRYTPDFDVMLLDGTIEMHEIKGFWRDDAFVKIKVAAAGFPFKFRSFQYKSGNWIERNFS